MATVWRATDTVLTRPVAVKVLHADLAADPEFVARFRREAVAAARLAHPSIVAIYDTADEPEAIVMELVEGRTLRDELDARGFLPPAEAVSIASSICLALEAAHRAGIVHRDVKPANVLLSADGRVKVADFGIAKAARSDTDDDLPDLTAVGRMVGTAKYLAPEQVVGRRRRRPHRRLRLGHGALRDVVRTGTVHRRQRPRRGHGPAARPAGTTPLGAAHPAAPPRRDRHAGPGQRSRRSASLGVRAVGRPRVLPHRRRGHGAGPPHRRRRRLGTLLRPGRTLVDGPGAAGQPGRGGARTGLAAHRRHRSPPRLPRSGRSGRARPHRTRGPGRGRGDRARRRPGLRSAGHRRRAQRGGRRWPSTATRAPDGPPSTTTPPPSAASRTGWG